MDKEIKQNKEKEEQIEIINIWENQLYEQIGACNDDIDNLRKKFDSSIKILNNSIILNLNVIEFLLKKCEKNALLLFLFYNYISKLQKDSKNIWCSNSFTIKNLGWGKYKFLEAKKKLKELGLIKIKKHKKMSENGKLLINKWFIEIVPILNAQNILKSSNKEVSSGTKTEPLEGTKNEFSRGTIFPPLEKQNHSSIKINNNSIKINNTNNNKLLLVDDVFETSSKHENKNITNDLSSFKEEKNKKSKKSSAAAQSAAAKKETNPVVKEVFRYFKEKCIEEFDIVPVIDYGKDGKMIKSRLKILEENGFIYKDLIDWFFENEDITRISPTLAVIFSGGIVNKFLSIEKVRRRNIKVIQEFNEKIKGRKN